MCGENRGDRVRLESGLDQFVPEHSVDTETEQGVAGGCWVTHFPGVAVGGAMNFDAMIVININLESNLSAARRKRAVSQFPDGEISGTGSSGLDHREEGQG